MKLKLLFVLLFASLAAGQATQPATEPVDLSSNQLVQKALAEQAKAEAAADADYVKKLKDLDVERQKKLEAAKAACVVALTRAESVATVLKHSEEAATIKELAESLKGPTSQPTTRAVHGPHPKFVGKWVAASSTYTLNADGTVSETALRGVEHWRAESDDVVIITRDLHPRTDRFTCVNGKWFRQSFVAGRIMNGMEPITPPD